MPWGCACTIPLEEQCCQPQDQREGWKGSTYPQLCNQVTAPSPASALLSLKRAMKCQIHVCCKAQGEASPGLPHPREGRPEWQAHDKHCVSWAPLVQSSWPSGGDQLQLAQFGSCWSRSLNQGWGGVAWICLSVFLTDSLCTVSCMTVLFKDVN